MAVVTLGVQAWAIHSLNSHWQTMAFTVLCFSQLGHVMAIRSDSTSIFKIGVFSNKPMLIALCVTSGLQLMVIYTPFFNQIFRTQPLNLFELTMTILLSSIVFWAVELEKWIKNLKK
ncbi:Calcium-transporting ATPase 1 [compost metagenome]